MASHVHEPSIRYPLPASLSLSLPLSYGLFICSHSVSLSLCVCVRVCVFVRVVVRVFVVECVCGTLPQRVRKTEGSINVLATYKLLDRTKILSCSFEKLFFLELL